MFSGFVYEPVSIPQRYCSGQSTPLPMPPSHQRMWAEVFEKFTEVEGVDLVADVLWVRGYL